MLTPLDPRVELNGAFSRRIMPSLVDLDAFYESLTMNTTAKEERESK